jgi:CPA2 family monovalent cation:H+ antiporter-2
VLGYILAGLVIGPHVPVPLVANPGLVHILSELGVILLMFPIGTELKLSTLGRVGLPAGLTAVFEVALVIIAGTLVATALGWPPAQALFAGACLGISSTMLVAKAFEELGWKGGFTEIVFAVLVFEDLLAILLLAILAGVSSGSGLDATGIVHLIGRLGGFLLLLLVGGLILVPRSVRWIARRARPETLLIIALALCFAASTLAHHAGYSVALGAFIAGVLIAESGEGHTVFELVRPIRDVFGMVFFVSVGMTIVPEHLLTEAPRILVLTAVVLIAKPLGVTIGVFLSGHGVNSAVRAGLSLAQIGELSFVIAGLVGGESLLAVAVGVSCATTITSSFLVGGSERIAAAVSARLPKRIGMFVSFYESWLARLRSREGSGWQRYKRGVYVLLLDTAVLITIAITASTAGPRYLVRAGLEGLAVPLVLIGVSFVLAAPFAISMIRRVALLSRRLATEVIPVGEPMDLGRAPRRALIVTLELGMALAIAVPIVAAVQPFVPGSFVLVLVVALLLLIAMRRSIKDFEGHVRAGSELILELLSQNNATPIPLAQMETILPGFGGTASITLPKSGAAVGRSLAELDLRAQTGATVLAIGRGEQAGLATPSPTEPLRAGDVLAVTGNAESIAKARVLLTAASRATDA